jgi:hypothetical protein
LEHGEICAPCITGQLLCGITLVFHSTVCCIQLPEVTPRRTGS